ncbi:TonB-dependent receptor domain-containing protein [Sphingomonas cavernae]|uniref:TonB-dependent receptor n=1 Tax=Sphingomonas cavernae TaxID=2320861 RepID=A0A418W7D0_9SPHN|nr:TonB-dependent receptor [Sphingomonas cavernae]RJF85909.1 TonB-dependent receptor [Sphingomonas cavernae]
MARFTKYARFYAGVAPLALGLMSAVPAAAQDAAAVPAGEAADASADEAIIVTGSRIARSNLDNSVPTLVVGADRLEQQGFENIADIANSLPQFAPSFGNGRASSSFSGSAASGLNLTNLRNLSALRSVVLINGRRVPGGTPLSTSVDFNTLPTANIERLEVITGGASAIYGADAVAGVVNIITKSNFRGLEVGVSYGIAEETYNKNPSAYVMFGGDMGDGGHFLFTTQYTYEGLVSCADAYVCNTDIRYNNPAEGPVRAPGTGITGAPPLSGVGLGGNFFLGTTNFTRDLQTGALRRFDIARDGFNRNPERTLAIPTKRLTFAAEVEYPISDSIDAFAEFNYGRSSTNAPIEAIAFQTTSNVVGGGPGVPGLPITIPVNNPFFLAATTPAQRALLTPTQIANGINWSQRFSEFGRRGATNERNTVRALVGLKGDFELGSRNWNWEASYVYGRTELESITDGLVGTDRLYHGLRVEADPARPGQFRCIDAGARAQGCVPVNPFAPYTQAQIDYLTLKAGQNGISTLHDFSAYVSGTLFDLPAGAVSLAAGVEYRTFSGFQDVDEVISLGLTTSNQIGDTEFVKSKTREAYAELIVPVLRDAPFAHDLSLEGAFRLSDPGRGSSYETWKLGGTWEPVEGLRFRAIRAKAVRAPTPGELGGIGQTFGNVQDPCTIINRNANATRAANCLTDGVPADYNPPLLVLQGVGGTIGGNPDLEPEEAKTWTYGLVFTPTFLPGFSLTVDRFEIEIDGFINTVGRQNKVNLCYDTTDRQFCNDIVRGFRPEVNGNFALTAINDQLLNVNTFVVKGIDVEASYSFDPGISLGPDPSQLTVQLLSTIYDKAEQTEPTGEVTKLDGYAGGDTTTQGFLRWQATGNVMFRSNGFGMNYTLRYIPKTKASPFISDQFPKISDAAYHNIRLSYDVTDQAQLYFGVNNLFDRKPPIFPDNSTGSQAQTTIAGFYDVFGRSYFVGTKLNF